MGFAIFLPVKSGSQVYASASHRKNAGAYKCHCVYKQPQCDGCGSTQNRIELGVLDGCTLVYAQWCAANPYFVWHVGLGNSQG